MGKVAFLFAGQGAQHPGMCADLIASEPAAKAVFDAADAVRPGTTEQCLSGTKEELSQTINTQPCVFAADLACASIVPILLPGEASNDKGYASDDGELASTPQLKRRRRKAQERKKGNTIDLHLDHARFLDFFYPPVLHNP